LVVRACPVPIRPPDGLESPACKRHRRGGRTTRGDHSAFEEVDNQFAGPVYGLVRKVLRDPAQSEEVAREVMLNVWRTASRFDAARAARAPG
jgi:RNA polymerase sigma-70 factor, ECF subfamily